MWQNLVLIGLGFGSNQPIYQSAVMSAVPHEFVGVASSQVQFWRSMGQTMGVTVLGTVLASQVGARVSDPEGVIASSGVAREALGQALHYVFLVAAAAVTVAVVVALTLKEVPMRGRARRGPVSSVGAAESTAVGE